MRVFHDLGSQRSLDKELMICMTAALQNWSALIDQDLLKQTRDSKHNALPTQNWVCLVCLAAKDD